MRVNDLERALPLTKGGMAIAGKRVAFALSFWVP
jgi:hypothetical protein